MQLLMDDSGSTHLLLSILVKHLDHKNVLKQPDMQLDVVEVVTALARLTKMQSSVPIVSAVSDIMRHLRKSIHYSLDDANLGEQVIKWNRKFHQVVDECLTELTSKVGDAGQILDVMASMLENISSITVIARTTISVVYRTAQIIAALPNVLYKNKAFPDALFHQLLPPMVHSDHQTRVGAHQIFSVVLVPSSDLHGAHQIFSKSMIFHLLNRRWQPKDYRLCKKYNFDLHRFLKQVRETRVSLSLSQQCNNVLKVNCRVMKLMRVLRISWDLLSTIFMMKLKLNIISRIVPILRNLSLKK